MRRPKALALAGGVLLVAVSSMLAGGPRASAAELDEVRAQLALDIQAAQRALSDAQATVSRERGALAEQIREAQNRVLDLREQAVAARRLADEETLSLSRIESRLETWQEQSRFQSRLLAGFLDRSGRRSPPEANEIDMRADLEILSAYLDEQQARLYPGWRSGDVVLANGEIGTAHLLKLGPVQWFWREEPLESGLVRSEDGIERASLEFTGSAAAGLANLYRGSEGVVTFDPTLSRALLLAEDRETLWQHLRKGGIWVVPILFFALFASITAVLKAVSLYRLPALQPVLAERVKTAVEGGEEAVRSLLEGVHGPQAALVGIALAGKTREQRDDRLYAALLEQRNRLERWLGAIALTASVSPLLGLLGTVSGMIVTFRLMTLFGAGDPTAVSAGISEALVTTELGLVVAIPALLAHALMSRKVKSYFAHLENDAVQLSETPVRA